MSIKDALISFYVLVVFVCFQEFTAPAIFSYSTKMNQLLLVGPPDKEGEVGPLDVAFKTLWGHQYVVGTAQSALPGLNRVKVAAKI